MILNVDQSQSLRMNGYACSSNPTARMETVRQMIFLSNSGSGLKANLRKENRMETPTINRKNGKMRSVGVYPCQTAWRRGGAHAPRRLVWKRSAHGDSREVEVWRLLASAEGVPLPHCFAADERGLLLQDLSDTHGPPVTRWAEYPIARTR